MASIFPSCILTPEHIHGARTALDYYAKQRKFITGAKQRHPGLNWNDPHPVEDKPAVFIDGGKWLIHCQCGNCPCVHPDCKIALCFECGAMYGDLDVPNIPDVIEALLQRKHPTLRAWVPGETVEDIVAQNEGRASAEGGA